MIRVAALGSGSSGNSLLVQAGSTTLLVDCGFTMKETIAVIMLKVPVRCLESSA